MLTSSKPDLAVVATRHRRLGARCSRSPCVAFALIASEFMPVSLLTPISADLGISEGQPDRRFRFRAFA